MSWTQLLATRKVHKHQTSKQKFRAIVARDLQDAAIPALSEDRRFVTAYNASLQTAKMAIACAGYRVGAVPGHHALTFEAASLALGNQAKTLLDYFEGCRRKRNVIDYTGVRIATATEAAEVLLHAKQFKKMVEAWIKTKHPQLS